MDFAAAAPEPLLRRTLLLTASTIVRKYLVEAEALVTAGKIPRRVIIDHQDAIAKVSNSIGGNTVTCLTVSWQLNMHLMKMIFNL